MNWKVKAIIQKVLSTNKIGDQLNHTSALLNKKYHVNVFQYQTHECLRKINDCSIIIDKEATALEIGTGYSILSAIVLALLGFKKVVTVDITNDLKFSSFRKQVHYLDSSDFLKKLLLKSAYSKQDIEVKIESIKKATSFKSLFNNLNIIYIAPYTFEDIEKECMSFNYITSQVVLEHVSPSILDTLFYKTKRWLASGGFIVHTINFIDHFANPGIFQDKSISEFNFLRYSDKYWDSWAGNSIAYTNRLSYLYYLELSERHDLNVIKFEGENYRKRKELDLKLIHSDVKRKYKSGVNIELLTKYQRGTLVLN